jgi:hypothetical protein
MVVSVATGSLTSTGVLMFQVICGGRGAALAVVSAAMMRSIAARTRSRVSGE